MQKYMLSLDSTTINGDKTEQYRPVMQETRCGFVASNDTESGAVMSATEIIGKMRNSEISKTLVALDPEWTATLLACANLLRMLVEVRACTDLRTAPDLEELHAELLARHLEMESGMVSAEWVRDTGARLKAALVKTDGIFAVARHRPGNDEIEVLVLLEDAGVDAVRSYEAYAARAHADRAIGRLLVLSAKPPTPKAVQAFRKLGRHVELFACADLVFLPTDSVLVPRYRVMTPEELEREYPGGQLVNELPQCQVSDPAIRIHGILPGEVVTFLQHFPGMTPRVCYRRAVDSKARSGNSKSGGKK